MREDVKRDEQFPDDHKNVEFFEEELIGDSTLEDIRDILMIQTALLMRLYDVQMAQLGATSGERAKGLWDLHDSGGHRNPATMIPNFEKVDDEAPGTES